MAHSSIQTEADRLATLEELEILDTPPSAACDALVASVGRLLDMPICLLSLIDDSRQWFKAGVGLDVRETARDVAFCDYTIRSDDLFLVEDATADPRFRANPLVTGEPDIRFYAGAPLRMSNGHRLGSLCVIDRKPRTLSDAQKATLRELSLVAVALIEKHATSRRNVRLALEATEQKRLAEDRTRELALRERRFMKTEAFAKVGGFEIDVETGLLQWSDEAYRIFGIPIGTPVVVADVKRLFVDRDRVDALIARIFHGADVSLDEEFEIRTPKGDRKWIRVAGSAELAPPATSLFGMVQDVSLRRSAELRLWHAANHDPLTGLANRAHLTERLDALFAGRCGLPSDLADLPYAALLMVDVDRLKEVNDTLGHDAGDALLREAAARLAKTVGDGGFVSRVGGDEFVVLIEGEVSAEALARLGEDIVAAMGPMAMPSGHALHLQVSIGGALAAADDSGETLRQKADLALYEGKRGRRGRFVEFREDMRLAVLHRTSTLRTVEEALADGRIVPHYQPLIRLATREIMALEALARMRLPDGRIVAAGAFQEALSDNRIAYALTGQMLAQVAADVGRWLDEGRPVPRIGINVTTADFQAGDLYRRVKTAFEQREVPLKHVVVEVTEMVFMDGNEAPAIRALQALRDEGVFVALDDFGTGYASLTQLRTLPVDVLKIDKSFVNRMMAEATSSSIVEGLIDLTLKLGLNVVAEGIETVEQAERLDALGCHFGQGYLFARPDDAAKAGELLSRFCESKGSPMLKRPSPIPNAA